MNYYGVEPFNKIVFYLIYYWPYLKEAEEITQGAGIVRYTSLRLRRYDRVEGMKNQLIPKQITKLQWNEERKEEDRVEDGGTRP
jgi:hypothetical protein